MDWVKSMTDYYRDLAIATGTDAMEVMFTRGNALAGELETHGFIPDAMLTSLTRKPALAKKTADQLVKADLWERVRGGYLIVNFTRINAEAEKLIAKKKRDRDRKRAERAATRGAVSEDVSADSPATRPEDSLYDSESKSQSKTAAAAAVAATAAAAVLPASIDILRSKIQAHTKLQALRFDGLTPERIATIEQLIEVHGDERLVTIALDTCRATPPVHVSAFLGTWAALPAPGQRLRVVEPKFCPVEHHTAPLDPSGKCRACITDAKVGEN